MFYARKKLAALVGSPANTNPTLSQGADPKNKKRPYASYFRVATTDAIQGPFAANYATEELKAKTVALIGDGGAMIAGAPPTMAPEPPGRRADAKVTA